MKGARSQIRVEEEETVAANFLVLMPVKKTSSELAFPIIPRRQEHSFFAFACATVRDKSYARSLVSTYFFTAKGQVNRAHWEEKEFAQEKNSRDLESYGISKVAKSNIYVA